MFYNLLLMIYMHKELEFVDLIEVVTLNGSVILKNLMFLLTFLFFVVDGSVHVQIV